MEHLEQVTGYVDKANRFHKTKEDAIRANVMFELETTFIGTPYALPAFKIHALIQEYEKIKARYIKEYNATN